MKNATYMQRVFGHNAKPAIGMDSFRAGRYERDGVDQCWNLRWDGNLSARDGLLRRGAFPEGHILWGLESGAMGVGNTIGVVDA
jgi:hypothetical protein